MTQKSLASISSDFCIMMHPPIVDMMVGMFSQ